MIPVTPAAWYVAIAAVLLPTLTAAALYAVGKRKLALAALLYAMAAALVAGSFLLLDSFVGFGRMAAFYGGVAIAALVGTALGLTLRRL